MADPNIPPSTSGLDIAAFVTAFVAPVIGLGLGIVAVLQERRRPQGPSGLAIAAIVISGVSILLLAGVIVAFQLN